MPHCSPPCGGGVIVVVMQSRRAGTTKGAVLEKLRRAVLRPAQPVVRLDETATSLSCSNFGAPPACPLRRFYFFGLSILTRLAHRRSSSFVGSNGHTRLLRDAP